MTDWKDCKDDLPQHQECVLCWDNGEIYMAKFECTTDKRYKKRDGIFISVDDQDYLDDVTHWMPLPKPQEAEND